MDTFPEFFLNINLQHIGWQRASTEYTSGSQVHGRMRILDMRLDLIELITELRVPRICGLIFLGTLYCCTQFLMGNYEWNTLHMTTTLIVRSTMEPVD